MISCQLLNCQDGVGVYVGMFFGMKGVGFDLWKVEKIVDCVLELVEYWQDGMCLVLLYCVVDFGMMVVVVVDYIVEMENFYNYCMLVELDIVKDVFCVQVKVGVLIILIKFVSYYMLCGVFLCEFVDCCCWIFDCVVDQGVEVIFWQQWEWFDVFWECSDVCIDGCDDLQQVICWCLFQLVQVFVCVDGVGVLVKGVLGFGYSGYYFWDIEIYVFFFFIYMLLCWVYNVFCVCVKMLLVVCCCVVQFNEVGVFFFWCIINGEEVLVYYVVGIVQYYINVDISFVLGKYVCVMGDEVFFCWEGVDIVIEMVWFWVMFGFWCGFCLVGEFGVGDGIEMFYIYGVIGLDEYMIVVNDNFYMNVMVCYNLCYVVKVVCEICESFLEDYVKFVECIGFGLGEVELWECVVEVMYILYSEVFGIYLQDLLFFECEVWDLVNILVDQCLLLLYFYLLVIYCFQVFKQVDVVLVLFLQGNYFIFEEKKVDFDYYDLLIMGDFMLLVVVQLIFVVEVGYQDFVQKYFEQLLFVDLYDLYYNVVDGVYVVFVGGVWMVLVCGFGGMCDYVGDFSFDLWFFVVWLFLLFLLQWQGFILQVMVIKDELWVQVCIGFFVFFSVWDIVYIVIVEDEVVVWFVDQGLLLFGCLMLCQLIEVWWEDGICMLVFVFVIIILILVIELID